MKESILNIEGMTCSSCVRHVEGALRELDGITAVRVDLAKGEARVAHDPELAPIADLVAAVEGAGYAASAPMPSASRAV